MLPLSSRLLLYVLFGTSIARTRGDSIPHPLLPLSRSGWSGYTRRTLLLPERCRWVWLEGLSQVVAVPMLVGSVTKHYGYQRAQLKKEVRLFPQDQAFF